MKKKMQFKNYKIVLVVMFFGFAGCDVQKKEDIKIATSLAIDAKIDSILNLMTLDEKIGQLNLPAAGEIITGQAQNSDVAKKITDGKVGGLLNLRSVEKIREVQKLAVEKSRLGIPLFFCMDVIHGYETTFPIPIGLASSWNMELIKKTAEMSAHEASSRGINVTFSPMVDITRDPRWGRVAEGPGEDAFLASAYATAMVEGYQGDNLADENTIISCFKHFALYGAPDAGRDYNTVDMSRIRMYNEYLPPYKAAVDAGAFSAMASFNEVDGIPATGNKWLLTNLLRNEWKFDGFVVTDYTGINEMITHGMGNLQECSALALNAGVDMDMVGEGYLTTLSKSIEVGLVSINDVDKAVRRILMAKYKLGLFDDPYKYCSIDREETEIFTAENRDFARKVASESMVLLKNNDQLLPIKKSGHIALIGPLANTRENMGGTWSVATNQEKSISLLDGLKEVVGDQAIISYAKGSNLVHDLALETRVTMFGKEIPRDGRTDQQLLDEAVAVASKSDVVIAALGESAEMSGESSSRTNIQIPQIQKDLLNALLRTGKPVVLVLFTGRPLVLNEENENVSAILNVWFPGSEAGLAISDVLFGDVNPSGKLTITFPRNIGQVPIFYSHKNTGRPLMNTEGVFQKFTSNYLDEVNEPLYPFGFGLSYTSFKYKNMRLSAEKLSRSGSIEASVEITNDGNFDGQEVVQLYIRDMVGTITRPVKELIGFQKISFKKGETKTITFTISEANLKFYNSNLDYVAEPGDFEVFIGSNSRDNLSSEFVLAD